ncbi:hypothetical protein D3C86_1201120 [compost metagenome]
MATGEITGSARAVRATGATGAGATGVTGVTGAGGGAAGADCGAAGSSSQGGVWRGSADGRASVGARTGAAAAAAEEGTGGTGGADGAAGGSDPASGSRHARPSKTVEQAPQRTRPLRTRSWSGTTLNVVPHCGQRVVRAM